MTNSLAGQESLFVPDTWSGRTSPERSAATTAETSRPCSRKRSASSNRKPPVLKCLQKAGLPGAATATWTDDGAWLGEYTTRNTGECPSVAVESRLSQILEATPHTKYCLSARACQGILRRAARRGKDLPEMLKAVLTRQSQPEFGKPCHALNANAHAPCVVLDMTHACDVIRECGEIAPSLQARMGTGGNQVPLTYGIGNGQANEAQGMVTERAQTLNTMHDAQAVMCVSPARDTLIVRRLTPLECERLQGFPDGWTDIGDYTDSTGKQHKTSDSARYKAIGNSIALPFWRWMFGRMAAYLPEGATLGSLFDGIGGFPLCWEDVHGTGTAIWASEIEEFPIAVTKKRFGGAIT